MSPLPANLVFLLAAIWKIVLGVFGVANLIIVRKPNTREFIGKLEPCQGWIGAISVLWGAGITIVAILDVEMIRDSVPIWIEFLAGGLVTLGLGLILGIRLLKSFIPQPQAVRKIDMAVSKLAPFQGILGLIVTGLGIWDLIAGLGNLLG
jgi:hypothetical protein